MRKFLAVFRKKGSEYPLAVFFNEIIGYAPNLPFRTVPNTQLLMADLELAEDKINEMRGAITDPELKAFITPADAAEKTVSLYLRQKMKETKTFFAKFFEDYEFVRIIPVPEPLPEETPDPHINHATFTPQPDCPGACCRLGNPHRSNPWARGW